jgi:hypothetical protein
MPLSVKLSIGFLACLIVFLVYADPILFGGILGVLLTALTVFRVLYYFMEER